mgnify:CR=1 FL=1
MGQFGKKETRALPAYFERDQVGGLSHLLRHAKLGDLGQYKQELVRLYDQDYADSCIMGLALLLEKDQDKLKRLDELAPGHPPRSNKLDQRLLSLLIFRAMVPILAHPNLAALLIPGERTRERALNYMQAIYRPAQRHGEKYIASLEGKRLLHEGEITDEDIDRWQRGEIDFFD